MTCQVWSKSLAAYCDQPVGHKGLHSSAGDVFTGVEGPDLTESHHLPLFPAMPSRIPNAIERVLGSHLLVVMAHSDDAEITCGGLISSLTMQDGVANTKVTLVQLTRHSAGIGITREREASVAGKVLGASIEYLPHHIPDTALAHESTSAIVMLDNLVRKIKPTSVITHFHDDTHQDHAAANRIVLAACRNVPTILEVQPTFPSGRTPTAFRPTVFVQLEERHIANKLAALSCHESQMAKYGADDWLNSVRSITQANAWMYCGVHGYAEIFSALRIQL